jgi:hypothetical protein
MHARNIVLAVLAAAVTLTSVASAGPTAAKQRVAINANDPAGGNARPYAAPGRSAEK